MVGSKITGAVQEAVAAPVIQEAQQAATVGMEQIAGTSSQPQDPQALQQKKEDEQKRKIWALRVIDWYKRLQEEQAKVRQQKQQEQMAKQQSENQGREVKQFKIFQQKQQKRQLLSDLERKARSKELRGGIGG